MTLYFAYGSLIDPVFQYQLFGEQLKCSPARIYDYQLALVGEFPTIYFKPNHFVDGKILSFTPSQEKIAEDWEGENYHKVTRQVVLMQPRVLIDCQLYLCHSEATEDIEVFHPSTKALQILSDHENY